MRKSNLRADVYSMILLLAAVMFAVMGIAKSDIQVNVYWVFVPLWPTLLALGTIVIRVFDVAFL